MFVAAGVLVELWLEVPGVAAVAGGRMPMFGGLANMAAAAFSAMSRTLLPPARLLARNPRNPVSVLGMTIWTLVRRVVE